MRHRRNEGMLAFGESGLQAEIGAKHGLVLQAVSVAIVTCLP